MKHLKATFPISERRAARVVSVSRSTLRYAARIPDDEPRLIHRMEVLVRKHPRYGYRKIGDLLRREGFRANPKRVYRLWKREGYRVAPQQHKRRRLGASQNACHRHRPARKNHIWALDFIFDRDEGGRSLKWLSVLDEYTRECPSLLCERSITALDVIDELIRVMSVRGVPAHIRADNGPEFIADAIRTWLEKAGVGTLYVEPGAPWENGYAESFHARLRDEFLNAEAFANLREAKALGEHWRREYNHERPHSSLGSLTPSEFAAGPVALPVGATPLPQGNHRHHDPGTLIADRTESGLQVSTTIHSLYEALNHGFRRRRMQAIERILRFTDKTTIVDIGGTPEFWEHCSCQPAVTLVNIVPCSTPPTSKQTCVVGDGRALPFPDQSFDVAFSNSVIEHVGGWEDRQRFAAEIRRVGRVYAVQTPARGFPVEPHFLAPFLHWLPMRLRIPAARWASLWGFVARPSKEDVVQIVPSIRLLCLSDMRTLFPDAVILQERFLGLTKSYTAIRFSAGQDQKSAELGRPSGN